MSTPERPTQPSSRTAVPSRLCEVDADALLDGLFPEPLPDSPPVDASGAPVFKVR